MTSSPLWLVLVVAVAVAGDRSRARYRPPGHREVARPQSPAAQEAVARPVAPREPRPRTRLATPAPRDYNYRDYDYPDYDYSPATTPRPRSRPRARTLSRVTTQPPRRFEYPDYPDTTRRTPTRTRPRTRLTTRPPRTRPDYRTTDYTDYRGRGDYSDYQDYSDYNEGRPRTRLTTKAPTRGQSRRLDQRPSQVQAYSKEEKARRNQLFLQSKERYCSPLDLPPVEEEVDSGIITVTHLLAGGIWGLGSTTTELVPVDLLRSTDISGSPLIFYSANTASNEIVFSGLVADTKEEVVVRPTCVLGRSSIISSITTRNQYTVQPVTQSLLLPHLDQPDLTKLLASLLAKDMFGSSLPSLPSLPPLIAPSTSLVTSLSTIASTYLTTLTETDTTLISLTFRGKEVVSTLTSTSTHEVVATEFSTSTIITPALVAAPALTTQPLALPSVARSSHLDPSTYLVTRTSTMVATSTQEQTTVIPITLRGKAISTTLTGSSVVLVTSTSLYTETVTRAPALAPAPDLLALAPVLSDLGLTYGDLDLELVSLLLSPSLSSSLPSLPLQDWTDPLDTPPSDLWDNFVLSGKNF